MAHSGIIPEVEEISAVKKTVCIYIHKIFKNYIISHL